VNAEKTLNDLALQQMEGDFGEMAKTWRKFGVLGKLHNIVKYIRMTPQRRQEFRRCVINKADLVKFNKLEVSAKYSNEFSVSCPCNLVILGYQ
jgi:hypothetical protein